MLMRSARLLRKKKKRERERERETSTSRNGGSPLERLNEIEIVDSAGSCKVEDLPPPYGQAVARVTDEVNKLIPEGQNLRKVFSHLAFVATDVPWASHT